MQDTGKILKWSFFILLLIVVFIIAIRLTRQRPVIVIPPDIDEQLIDSGFVKPGNKPEIKPGSHADIPGVTPVVSGSGIVVAPPGETWPETLHVETSVVTGPDGKPWIGTWINDYPVQWIEAPQILWPSLVREPSDWSAFVEAVFIEEQDEENKTTVEVDWGGGVAWTPLTVLGAHVGPAASIDLSVVHETGPEWGAVSGHVWRPLGPARIGCNLGYRFGRGEGFHGAVTVGVGLDL